MPTSPSAPAPSIPTTMRAVVAPEPGEPSVLEVREVPVPEPGPGEVLLRVAGAGVNPVDAKTRAGGAATPMLRPGGGDAFPWIPGWDVAGTVEAVGYGTTRFSVGDRAFGLVNFPRTADAYAEYVVAHGSHLAPTSPELTDVEAAALPLAGLTAWQALVDAGGLHSDQRILVTAAAGGVGHVAVQLAGGHGAHVVAVGSTANVDFLRGLGAAEVLDRTAVDPFETDLLYDVVIDAVGGEVRRRAARVVRPGGTLVTLPTNSAGEDCGRDDISAPVVFVAPDSLELQLVVGAVERGVLRPHVSHELPLERAAEAHALMEDSSVRGKVVLVP